MRKLVLSIVLLFGLFIGLSFTENIVEAAEPTTGQDVTFTYTINKNGVETTSSEQIVDYGTTVSIDSGSHDEEDFSFVGFIENNKVNPTLNTSESFRVTENLDLTLFYKDSSKTAVILMDANQDYIGVWYTDGSNVLDTTINPLPNLSNYSKPGLTTDGWTLDGSTVISDLSTETFLTDDIVYIKYSDPATADLTLTVTNGSGGGSYKFNETVTVDTTGSTGTTFNYWLKDGEIASYDESYTFTMVTNHTLEAVYDSGSFTPHTGNFIYASEAYVLQDDYITILAQFDLDTDEELVEWGIVYSDTETTPTLSTSNTTIKYSNKYNATTGEFVMSFDNSASPLGQYYRAFITTIDSGNNISIDYSSVINKLVSLTLYTSYNTYGDEMYLGYMTLFNGSIVQAWNEDTKANWSSGTNTPGSQSYDWSVTISVLSGVVVEWKMIHHDYINEELIKRYMSDPNRSIIIAVYSNHFSSWDNGINEKW